MENHHLKTGLSIAFILACFAGVSQADRRGQHIDLEPPGERDFVLDNANLIEPGDVEAIRKQCDTLLTDKAIPIVVVTIGRMSDHVRSPGSIERFAANLFDQWEIGIAEINGQDWNTGILLLVSKSDRKARIELGAGWEHSQDQLCREIMDNYIIPSFKKGDFSGGIAAGVNALEHMARGKELPTIPRPWWHYAMIVGCIALAIFTFVSLFRRGCGGWAWLFWGAVFGLIGFILYQTLRNSDSGGFSGGSFGGGFSGGGGATGSW